MWICYIVTISTIFVSVNTQGCTDNPEAQCTNLVQNRLSVCYDGLMKVFCCQTCETRKLNIPNCMFGDREEGCTISRCSTEEGRTQCCLTCQPTTTTTTTTTTTPSTTSLRCPRKNPSEQTCIALSSLGSAVCTMSTFLNLMCCETCFESTTTQTTTTPTTTTTATTTTAPIITSGCSDNPAAQCSTIVQNRPSVCYDALGFSMCCSTCENRRKNVENACFACRNDCMFGDREPGCTVSRCNTENGRNQCCFTCQMTTMTTTTTPTTSPTSASTTTRVALAAQTTIPTTTSMTSATLLVNGQSGFCFDRPGCRRIKASDCYDMQPFCCARCKKLEKNIEGCLYGDRRRGCNKLHPIVLNAFCLSRSVQCCETCHKELEKRRKPRDKKNKKDKKKKDKKKKKEKGGNRQTQITRVVENTPNGERIITTRRRFFRTFSDLLSNLAG